MGMMLTDEQRMLAETVRPFLGNRAPVSHLRKLRDGGNPEGFDRDVWRGFAEIGLSGILVGDEHGGTGLGHVETGIVQEQIGQNLTPSPFLPTSVGAATALQNASPDLQKRWLPGIATGNVVAAIALEEHVRHRPEHIATRATRQTDGFVLNGTKRFVVHGGSADLILVVARTSGDVLDTNGLTIVAIEPQAPGIAIEDERLVDSSVAATIRFADTPFGPDQVIGAIDEGHRVLNPLLTALRIAAAAELVGVGSKAFAMTLDYLKQRNQFDRPIGSFQALQHRAAHLHSELEMARAAVLKGQLLFDAGDPEAQSAAMIAKAAAGGASALAVQEGVQMHGGVGMTDEFDIGLYMKRQRVLAEMFGDADYHVDRLALLGGY